MASKAWHTAAVFLLMVALLIAGCKAKPEDTEPTLETESQVESLIRGYFTALERKEYATAWEMTYKHTSGNFEEFRQSWERQIASLKLLSIRKYRYSASQGLEWELPPGTYTHHMFANVEIRLKAEGSAWYEGENGRFIGVRRDETGHWKIDALATSP